MATTSDHDLSDRLLQAIRQQAEREDVTPAELRDLAEAYAWIHDTSQSH